MAHSKTSRFRISRCKHGTRAVKLRLQGLTFEEIGKRLNCSSQRAYQIVKGELELETRKRRLAAGQLMQVELARLEEAHKAIYPKVKAGDLGAIAAMVKLCERRAKLLGLDVPDRSPQAGAVVTLNVQEVIVNKHEDSANGDALDNGEAASRPTSLPEE